MVDLRAALRRISAFLLVCVATSLCAAGCSSVSLEVESDFDSSVDFAAIKTWNWLPGKQPEIRDPRVVDSIVNARMRRAIANELASHQLKSVDHAVPDVWVRYLVWVLPREDFNPVRRTDSSRALSNAPKQDAVDDVGLRIEMFDGLKRTHKIWSAEGRAQMNLRVSTERRDRRTAAAVRKLLSRFPPK